MEEFGVVSPATRTKIHRDAGSGVLLLRAGLASIHERLRELTGMDIVAPVTFERSLALDGAVGGLIRRLINYLVDDATQTGTVLTNPILRNGIDDMLLNAILAVPNNYSDVLRGDSGPRVASAIVRRAEQFLESRAHEPITISDAVAECGCSRRALFKRVPQVPRIYAAAILDGSENEIRARCTATCRGARHGNIHRPGVRLLSLGSILASIPRTLW